MRIIDDTGHPMMSPNEVKIIDTLLEEYEPRHCLEWGSGNSTVYFPKKHAFIKSWLALEDKQVYVELLENKIAKDKDVEIVVTTDKEKYIHAVEDNAIHDFIFIDGNWRDECLEVAYKIADNRRLVGLPFPLILLHDASRIESAGMMEKYKDSVKLWCEGEVMTNTGYFAHRGIAQFLPHPKKTI